MNGRRADVQAWKRTVFLTIFFLTALAGRAAGESPDSGDALETVTLQLKWQHQFQFAGYYAALAQGYYRKAGLNVRIVPAGEGAEPDLNVLEGKADFGVGTSELLVLRGEGKPVVVLASIFQHSPFVFVVNAKAGIENVHGLAGKRLAIEPRAAELLAYLKHEGIAKEWLKLSMHPYDPLALIEGRLDAMSAYSTNEPYALEQAGMQYKIFDPRAGGIDFYGDSLFTTEEQIRRHPQRVRAFLEASLKGWKYAFAHSDEIVDLILSQYSQSHSREHLLFEAEATRQLVMPDDVELGYINPGRWRFMAETYADLGMMPPDFSLKGFIYERNPLPRLARLYGMIAGLLALLLAAGFVALRFYTMNHKLKLQMAEQRRLSDSLQEAMSQIKTLAGLIPICCSCKRIRNDNGYWLQVETFIQQHTDAQFSHGICPECVKKLYPDD